MMSIIDTLEIIRDFPSIIDNIFPQFLCIFFDEIKSFSYH